LKIKVHEKIQIGQLLKKIFSENWDDIFLIDSIKEEQITYMEFFYRIKKYQEELEYRGLKKDDTICVILHNSIDLLCLYFSCLFLQITIVPIDPDKNSNEINEILSEIEYDLLITNNEISMEIKEINLNDINSVTSKSVSTNDLNLFESIDYDFPYLITFTSGTTGIPKGVIHSFSNLVSSALAFQKKFNFNKSNIFYHNLSMTYMAGILNLIILPLICESKIVIGEKFKISEIMNFWNIPKQYNVNTFWFIPTLISLLLKLDRGQLGISYTKKNKIIGCIGTAPLDHTIKVSFEKKYGMKLFESYGLSETLFVSTNFPSEFEDKTTGQLLDDVKLDFLDDGEILIKTPWMFLDYKNFNSKKFFKGGYYLSGDIGEINHQGFLSITNRKKDLIIKGGINLSPKKIEDYIKKSNFFHEVVVIGIKNEVIGEKIVCFYVIDQNEFNTAIKKKLNHEIISNLGKNYEIDQFVRIDEIPKNTNGKIDKPKILDFYMNINNDFRS